MWTHFTAKRKSGQNAATHRKDSQIMNHYTLVNAPPSQSLKVSLLVPPNVVSVAWWRKFFVCPFYKPGWESDGGGQTHRAELESSSSVSLWSCCYLPTYQTELYRTGDTKHQLLGLQNQCRGGRNKKLVNVYMKSLKWFFLYAVFLHLVIT